MRLPTSYANVMATIAVFLGLGGGAFALNKPPKPTPTISGCYAKRTGALRVLASSTRRCRRGERRIRWTSAASPAPRPRRAARRARRRGPDRSAGLQGRSRAAGPQGPAGSDATFQGAAAAGDLAGTYPAPTIAPGAVTASKLAGPAPATGLPLTAGWVGASAGKGPPAVAAYHVDLERTVHLRGVVSQTDPSEPAIAQLPVGARPPHRQEFLVVTSGNTPGAVMVADDGTVSLEFGNPARVFLDGIDFRTS